jgi:hypothetical protein
MRRVLPGVTVAMQCPQDPCSLFWSGTAQADVHDDNLSRGTDQDNHALKGEEEQKRRR